MPPSSPILGPYASSTSAVADMSDSNLAAPADDVANGSNGSNVVMGARLLRAVQDSQQVVMERNAKGNSDSSPNERWQVTLNLIF